MSYRGALPEFMATPLQDIADHIESGRMVFDVSEVFDLQGIAAAHRLMESNAAGGKIVVSITN